MRKYKIKGLNGFIYVESFGGKDKTEWDRAKIYDENMNYIDYICLDCKTFQEYKNILDTMRNSTNIENFIEYITGQTSYYYYDYSENLNYLLESMYEDADEEEWAFLHQNMDKMSEKELLEEYGINRIGNFYFKVCE